MDYPFPIKVFDFFSGCGGISRGFLDAGMEVVFALDNDHNAANTYRLNFPGVPFFENAIEDLPEQALQSIIEGCNSYPILFSGCAPCQPFTKQNTKRSTNQTEILLLGEFGRFVRWYKPKLVFVENVPGLQKVNNEEGPFRDFLKTLDKLDYDYRYDILASQSYGVPQKRRRLVLIASLLGPIEFPAKTHGHGTSNQNYSTVKEWIKDLPVIEAGETHQTVANHRAAKLSDINFKRIRSTPPGGSRADWPTELKLSCHTNGYTGHTDVYGRMKWDEPATGLTTRCISLSNGRFGHPNQDRAISVLEAACLQTFPKDFVFCGSLNSMARQIGNAVPVLLAEQFGENFINHVKKYLNEEINGKV